MIRALWSSASGMNAQQMNIDVIANNLANVNTTGFKKSSLAFQDIMYQTDRTPGAKLSNGDAVPIGLQVGLGTKPVATSKSFSQGDMVTTGNTLDIAIQGRGFFEVEMPDGTRAYTRDGSFKLNANGQVVTNSGYKLVGMDQVDTNATDLSLSSDGSVSVLLNGQIQQLSPVTLTNFPNPDGLRSMGDNLYQPSDGSGAAETGLTPGQNGMGTLQQGFLESSNVRIVEEMVKMIQAQRAYEVNSKAIQASDEMLTTANNLRR